jgi:predicted nucleic acid-binding Zn ribbon protein
VRPLTHALPGALRLLLHQIPLSSGKVEFAWTAAVGPAVARASAVKLEQGVLIVETTSAQWTAEIRRASPVILERLRSLLSDQTIERLEVRSVPNLQSAISNLQSHA